MGFQQIFEQYDWENVSKSIYSKTSRDIEMSLKKNGKRSIDDFMALVSPAAAPCLELIAKLSHELTVKRFGKTIPVKIVCSISRPA